MKLKLEDSVSSPQDLKALMLEVREYAQWFSHNAIKQRVHAKHTTPAPELSPPAKAQIAAWNAQAPLTPTRLDELLVALKRLEASAPQISITLAAPAPRSLKETLVAWCRQNIAPDVLVNFQFNSTLLGGMVVRSGSRVFDWSFRRQLLDARGNFPEVLRRV
jgi:hypothetical protein